MTATPIKEKRRQWMWFVLLWLAGFSAVGAISLLVKLVFKIAG